MNKIKLFFYPQANPIVQGSWCKDCVPFSLPGIANWVQLAGMKTAEFLHMGAITEFMPNPFNTAVFWKLKECPEKHLVDLEGDYYEGTFREEFAGTVRVANGAPHRWRADAKVFPRLPPVRMLTEMAEQTECPPPATSKCIGFVGKSDRLGIRAKVVQAAVGLTIEKRLALNEEWLGPCPPEHPARKTYSDTMAKSSIALCPQAAAVSTGRFYESCWWGRFPVIVGETMLLGEDMFDMGFVVQLKADLSHEQLLAELQKIADMPLSEMVERGKAARAYWDAVVRVYFQDPTKFFLEWMVRRGLWHG